MLRQSGDCTKFSSMVSTMLNIFFILLIFIIGLVSSNERKLEYVQTIFRHGHRAPRAHPYPNDKYDETYWPRGWGEMTEVGIHELVELGSFFRKRYGALISPKFNSEEILVRSSHKNRAKESAHAMLLGLFDGPVSTKIKGSILQKHAEHKYGQFVISGTKGPEDWLAVPSLDICSKDTNDSEIMEKEFADVFAVVRDAMSSSNSPVDLEGLDDIQKEIDRNLPQPDWVFQRWPNHDNMTTVDIGSKLYNGACYDRAEKDVVNKFYGRYLLNNFLENALLVSKENQTKRFIAYSSHDVTIVNLLYAFGYKTHHIPEYASAVIMEVYSQVKDGKKSYDMKVLIRECENGNPAKCSIKEANFFNECTYCSVDVIVDRYKDGVVNKLEDIDKLCEPSDSLHTESDNKNTITFSK